MFNREKKLILASAGTIIALVLVMIALVFMLFFQPQATGFVTLAGQVPEEKQVQVAVDENPISTELHFQVVRHTELSARLVKGETLPCPFYSELVFEVENKGSAVAERLFVDYPSNLVVENCINCSLKQLGPGQRVEVKINACESEEEDISVGFSSINAEKKSVRLG